MFEAMQQDVGSPLAGLSADGGASRNDRLMQFQADIIGRPVTRGDRAEASALGAAMMAAEGLGRPLTPSAIVTTFTPQPIDRDAIRGRWREAVARTLWAPHENKS